MGRKVKDVEAGDTSAMYTPGGPADESERVMESFTPEEIGYLKDTQVRCHNCLYGGGPVCHHPLTNHFPNEKFGCCNIWRSKKDKTD